DRSAAGAPTAPRTAGPSEADRTGPRLPREYGPCAPRHRWTSRPAEAFPFPARWRTFVARSVRPAHERLGSIRTRSGGVNLAARRERAALFRLLRLPELCPACRGPSEGGFCGECARGFRTLPRPCRICGLPGGGTCRRHDAGWAVARTRVVFEYAEPLAHYLQALKFGHGRTLGRALGLLLTAALNEYGAHADMCVDAL